MGQQQQKQISSDNLDALADDYDFHTVSTLNRDDLATIFLCPTCHELGLFCYCTKEEETYWQGDGGEPEKSSKVIRNKDLGLSSSSVTVTSMRNPAKQEEVAVDRKRHTAGGVIGSLKSLSASSSFVRVARIPYQNRILARSLLRELMNLVQKLTDVLDDSNNPMVSGANVDLNNDDGEFELISITD